MLALQYVYMDVFGHKYQWDLRLSCTKLIECWSPKSWSDSWFHSGLEDVM